MHALIDENENLPSGPGLRHAYGRPGGAHRLIGYMPDTDVSSVETDRHLRQKYPAVVQEVGSRLPQLGVHVERDPATERLALDPGRVVPPAPAGSSGPRNRTAPTSRSPHGGRRPPSDPSRLSFPALDRRSHRLGRAECNNVLLGTCGFEDLALLGASAERVPSWRARNRARGSRPAPRVAARSSRATGRDPSTAHTPDPTPAGRQGCAPAHDLVQVIADRPAESNLMMIWQLRVKQRQLGCAPVLEGQLAAVRGPGHHPH